MTEIQDKILKTEKIAWRDLQWFQGELKEIGRADLDKLKSSIKNNGFSMPFHVWNDNDDLWILDGHHRKKALEELEGEGYKIPEELPANFLECEDRKQAGKYVLMFASIYARVHDEGLYAFTHEFNLDFEDIKLDFDFPDFDFERYEIGYVKDKELEGVDLDAVPDPPEEPKTKLGDLYLLGGKHRLLCGDATKREDVKRLMGGEKADMVFTSAPYNANAKTGEGNIFNTKKCKPIYRGNFKDNMNSNEYIAMAKKALEMCFENTSGFIFWNVSYNANSRFEYIKQIEDKLEYLIEQVCWKKTRAIPFRYSLRRAWEPVYIFSTNKTSLHVSEVESNIWEVDNTHSQIENHKACFPIELPTKGIKLVKESKTVLDLFAGSGSTLIACEKLERISYNMEISPKYCDVIVQRYKDVTGKEAELI